MVNLLNVLIAAGGTTAYREPFTAKRIEVQFLSSPFAICCHCAEMAGAVIGFQALEWADPDWPGPDRLPADWAIISTYVGSARQRGGIGRALFEATRASARSAGVTQIDATIRRQNVGGLAYYSSLGFEDYRAGTETVSKVLRLA